jgi:hypothetical protein
MKICPYNECGKLATVGMNYLIIVDGKLMYDDFSIGPHEFFYPPKIRFCP